MACFSLLRAWLLCRFMIIWLGSWRFFYVLCLLLCSCLSPSVHQFFVLFHSFLFAFPFRASFFFLFSFVLVRQFITSLYSFPLFLLFGFLFQSVLLLSFCLARIFGFVLSFLPVCPSRFNRLNVLENVQPRLMIGRPPRLPHRLSASILFLFPRSFVRSLSLDSFSVFSFSSFLLSVCSVVVALFLFCVIPWFLCTLNFVD